MDSVAKLQNSLLPCNQDSLKSHICAVSPPATKKNISSTMHPNDGYDVDTGCKSSCNYPNAAPAPIRECAMNVCFNYVCHGLRQMRAKPAWYVFLFVLFCGKLGHLPGRRTRVKRMFVPWNNTSGGACFWSAPKKESCVCHGSARIRANTMFHGLVGGKFIKVLLQKSTLFTYVEIYSKSYELFVTLK